VSTDLLFVYGTLRAGARGPMMRFLSANSERIGLGTIRGKLYRIAHYPGLVASDYPRDVVTGDVLRLTDPTRVLKRLDLHEGCGPASPRPTEYVREVVTVYPEAGGEVQAWTYLYNWPVTPPARIRSGDFLGR
jgi:gamma-glutamylcyclotransferase (GGCT)/AIG2-like uncharacterized protein YtfP